MKKTTRKTTAFCLAAVIMAGVQLSAFASPSTTSPSTTSPSTTSPSTTSPSTTSLSTTSPSTTSPSTTSPSTTSPSTTSPSTTSPSGKGAAASKEKQPRPGRNKKSKSFDRVNDHVNVIKVAAFVLGKTEEEVKQSVKTGKVGDLLIKAGKVDAFKAAYLSELKTKLDEAVAAGTLTQETADQKYAKAKSKMDAYDGTTHLCNGKDHSKMFKESAKQKA